MSRDSIHQQVTDKIIALLERGTLPWRRTWKTGSGTGSSVPRNAITRRSYQGVNRIILWAAALAYGYASHDWATYRQIGDAGGHVRRGEHGTHVVFYRPVEVGNPQRPGETLEEGQDDESERPVWIMRAFTVFNIAQCEGLAEEPISVPAAPPINAIPAAEQFIGNVGARVLHGGDRAYYAPATDSIHLPAFNSFTSPEAYYATSLHEHVHWTGHPSRLKRLDRWAPFGSERYACEELVAELGAAFVCADLDVRGDLEHHASYIQNWLTVLRQDRRALFAAAADANRAVEHLRSLQPALRQHHAA